MEQQGRAGVREPLGVEPVPGDHREVTEKLFDRGAVRRAGCGREGGSSGDRWACSGGAASC